MGEPRYVHRVVSLLSHSRTDRPETVRRNPSDDQNGKEQVVLFLDNRIDHLMAIRDFWRVMGVGRLVVSGPDSVGDVGEMRMIRLETENGTAIDGL